MQAMAECSGPPQSACADALGTFYPSLETGGFLHPAFCTPIPMPASTPLILRKSRMRRRARTDLCGGRSVMIVPTATVIGWSVGLVPTNALGSRNASGRISREQTSERIVAVWGKRPEVVARLPIQIVNDKGRYHSR